MELELLNPGIAQSIKASYFLRYGGTVKFLIGICICYYSALHAEWPGFKSRRVRNIFALQYFRCRGSLAPHEDNLSIIAVVCANTSGGITRRTRKENLIITKEL